MLLASGYSESINNHLLQNMSLILQRTLEFTMLLQRLMQHVTFGG